MQNNPPVLRIKLREIPSWLPSWLRRALSERSDGGRIRHSTEFSAGERRALRWSPPMPVSKWAERYRIVENSSIRGRWSNVFTPYLTGIMDASCMPGVETVILCKSPQTGGSEAGHNIVGYCIDRLPGPVMYVFPDEITARENARERIIPMITATPRLSAYLTGSGDDMSSLSIRLLHMQISLAWSGSVSRLGNKPVRILVLDELDKYANPKNEARSEDLAEKRTTTWRSRRKIFKISTPTTEDGPIWKAFTQEANCRFRYFVTCPHCEKRQLMQFERITWPGKDTGEEPKSEEVLARRLAGYACEECGSVWNDSDRDRAVRAGEWREESSGLTLADHIAAHRPVKVGFHIPSWISYFVSLSEVARAWLKYRESGDIADLKNFNTQYMAEPWREQFEERDESDLVRLCDDRPRGAVPGPLADTPDVPRISCVLAGVDTQKGYFRYVVRAYGYGEEEESWLIQCGSLADFGEIETVLLRNVYRDASGREYHVQGIMMDAMGNRTRDVYAFAARHRGVVFPWQGKRSMSSPYSMTSIEYFPGPTAQKLKIPGGLTLFQCDTTFFKSGLAQKLTVNPEDPGAFHLHADDDGSLKQYMREMCAEVWDDEKMAWTNPMRRDNHFWDCEVMVSALAYIRGVRNIRRPSGKPQPAERRIVTPPSPAVRRGRY